MSGAESRVLWIARGAAIGVAVGAVVTPPLGNAAAAVMLVAFFFVPDWRVRLAQALRSRVALGVLVLLGALAVAAAYGALGPQGPRSAILHLVAWRSLLVLLLAFALFDTERSKRALMFTFIVVASIGAGLALGSLATKTGLRDYPVGVVLRNTVTQAMAFGVAAFFGLILLVTQRSLPVRLKVALGLAIVLLVGTMLVQAGRSGQLMFAILVGVAAVRVLRGMRRVAALAALPVLFAVAVTASPVVQQRFALAWDELTHAADLPEYSSMGIRVVMWQNSVELVRARPVTGYGLGGLQPAYAALVERQGLSGWKAIVTGDPHNQYLALWLDAGAFGLLAFLFFLACMAAQRSDEPWRSVALALLAGWCATSLASSHFQTFNEGHLIALFLGAMLAPLRRDAV